MELRLEWELHPNRRSTLLILKGQRPDQEILEKILLLTTEATHEGDTVVYKCSLNTGGRSIFILRWRRFEWKQLGKAVEEAIKTQFPNAIFENEIE